MFGNRVRAYGAFLVLLLAACSQQQDPTTGAHGQAPNTVAATSSTSSTPPSATSSTPPSGGCALAALPHDWSAALTAHRERPNFGEQITDYSMQARGPVVFRSERLPGHHNRFVMVRGSTRRTVMDLGDDYTSQVTQSSWNGRWLAFSIGTSQSDLGAFRNYLWDSSRQAPPVEFAHSTVDPATGETAPGPAPYPRLSRHAVYWSQISPGTRNTAILSRRDLASGAVRVINRSVGSGGTPTIWQDTVLWAQRGSSGTDQVFRAADENGRPVKLPEPLASARAVGEYASDATTVAWLTSEPMTLHAWRPGWRVPVTMLLSGTWAQDLTVSGDVAAFVTTDRAYTANLRTGAWAPLTDVFGGAIVSGGMLYLGYNPASKISGSDISVIDTRKLTPLVCP